MEMTNIFANVAEGTHGGSCTFVAAEAMAPRHLLVAFGAGENGGKVTIAGAADRPIGTATDEAAAGDPVSVQFLGGGQTVSMVSSEAIAQGAILTGAGGGRVRAIPSDAGEYIQIGVAIGGAAGANQALEVLPAVAPTFTVAGGA